ncbi:MAG: alpha/beta hydrolase [Proteobacteria bacterium]|nr:alpha/beta hydrolase [Pseudomonadota bacterium]
MMTSRAILLAFVGVLALAPRLDAQQPPPGFDQTAASAAAANSQPGARKTPPQTIPVPADEVSPQVQALIGGAYPPHFNAAPKNAAEWKELINRRAALGIAALPALKAKFGVTVEPTEFGNVKAFIVTPKSMPAANRNRLLVHVHGGGYVFGPGEAGLNEAVLLAGFGAFKVISVDYRMPPDHPYPAAMDDAMTVWRAAVKMANPRNMAIFGTSTGGAMTLAMVLRAKTEGLPLPAAIAPGTPWSDLTKTGDSYLSNEWVDNVLVTWDGWLGRAAVLYANGHDMKDPQLSPIYGDFSGFPPTILTSGTRDLFLSNTARTHRKLRRAGVVAELHVYEGQSHAQYGFNADAPETREAFTEIAQFFDRYLGK